MTEKIDLPADGACPCGDKDLLLARDQTKFTPVAKVRGAWEYGGDYAEGQDSVDPLGECACSARAAALTSTYLRNWNERSALQRRV